MNIKLVYLPSSVLTFLLQSTSSRLFVTASLSTRDRQDVTCLYSGFRTEFFNAKEQLYASYKKKGKNTHRNELKQKEIASNRNCCMTHCANSSSLFWLSRIFPLHTSDLAYVIGLQFAPTSPESTVLQLCYTAVIHHHHANLLNPFLLGAPVRLSTPVFFCYNHVSSAAATKHL